MKKLFLIIVKRNEFLRDKFLRDDFLKGSI